METNERGFRWEKELLLRAFFSSMIHAVRVYMVEENEKKSNVCKIFLTFPLPICELIEIKGMERSHHGAVFSFFQTGLFVPAIRESLLIYDDAFLFFFIFFFYAGIIRDGDDW